ncbi:mitochondrial carrier domain-containing protein [Melampsora americana]|nr:mitochondrial carrier domain-containing protein [Melampsora americana]
MEPTVYPRPLPQKHPLKDIGYGSVAGICSKLFEHPFDLVKVRLQSQPLDQALRFRGPWDCLRQTTAQEGIRGLYRGVSMPVIGAMAENATLFLVYGQVQKLIRHLTSDSTNPTPSNTPLPLKYVGISAACGGATTSFILTPIELIKCRMQVQQLVQMPGQLASTQSTKPQPLPGPLSIIKSALADGGVRGLWLGQTGTLLRETGGSAVWFCTFETMTSAFIRQHQAKHTNPMENVTKSDLSSPELMVSGAVAGIFYNVVFFPADSIKSAIQTESELKPGSSKAMEVKQKSRGFIEFGKAIVQARGWRGLYAGCGITCLRSGPSSALIFWIVSRLESRFD